MEKDLLTGEVIALPVSLLVLVVVFGGFLAAGMPIAGAVASIAGGLASLLAFSYLIDLDASVVNVVTVLGLGLCIDYSLLLVSRYRDELRLALDRHGTRSTRAARSDALAATMSTAGRTVLFSGLMVAISVGGLLVFRAGILRAVGAAAISVVLVAVCVALTFIPAVAAAAGTRLLRPGLLVRFPPTRALVTRLGDVPPASGRFSALAHWTQRRPWLVVVGTLAVLGVLAAPVLGLQVRNSGVALLPPDAPARVFFDTLDRDYPALTAPAVQVVAQASPGQLTDLGARLRADPAVASVPPPRRIDDRHAVVSVVLKDPDSGDAAAKALVADLREHRPDFPTWVTGPTAALLDFTDALGRQAPIAIAVVVVATFQLRLPRRHRDHHPAARARARVRAFHRLRGVPDLPDQGAARRRRRQPRRGGRRAAALRTRHHQCCADRPGDHDPARGVELVGAPAAAPLARLDRPARLTVLAVRPGAMPPTLVR